ncbi:MAG: hypothetical protein ACM3SP_21635 [Chloroflexota bacterium]
MVAITNEAQLQQAIEQIQTLCHAIESLRTDTLPKNPKNFAVLAEGPLDEIRKLQADIDAYIQQLESAGTTASG